LVTELLLCVNNFGIGELQNHLNKEGMQIISVKSHKEIAISYNSQTQDFDRFLPTVNRMIDTVSIEV
jgi:hypothetical protein